MSFLPAKFHQDIIINSSKNLKIAKRHLLNDLIQGNDRRAFDGLEKVAGVYAFWWIGNNEVLKGGIAKGEYYLKGPHINKENQELIPVDFNKEWIDSSKNGDGICLYVGKSTDIKNRVLGHIRYETENIWKDSKNGMWPKKNNKTKGIAKYGFGKKPNYVSQLRIGLERIFQVNCQNLILENVAVSWVDLSDKKTNNSINRFFIEDRLISEFYLLFNVDVER